MKRNIALWLLVMLPLTVAAQKSTLRATFAGLPDGTRIVVSEPKAGRMVPTDTLTPDKKGTIKMERHNDEPLFFMLAPLQSRGAAIHCLLLPREKVTMDLTYDREHNLMRITHVKGSKNMELYRQYNHLVCEAAIDPSRKETLADNVESIIRTQSTELMSAFIVTYFESVFDQYAPLYKAVRDDLIGRYPTHDFVLHLDQKLRKAVIVGMDAPEIALSDTASQTRRLSDLRGKVVLIDFWASWCRPCRAENPNVVRIYKKYHDMGFEIFSVSLDKDYDAWVNAIKADGLVWPNHVSDLLGWKSAAGQLYSITSIPSTVLVDRDGKVLARNLRGAKLESKLKEIFGQ